MPPDTSTAMRRPRSSSGIGVGSRGTALSYALAGAFDDPADLGHRALDVVVGHHVLVLARVLHLALGDLPAGSHVLPRFAAALLLPILQLLFRRGHDEDEQRIGHQAPDLLRALHVDLQHHVTAFRTRLLDAVAKGAVEVAVVGRVLEERTVAHQPGELFARQEGVVLARLLARPRPPRRARNRVHQLRVQLEQAMDERVLADPRRPRDDDEQASPHSSDAQNVVKSEGGAASKLMSAPVRGCRSRRRQAWSIGRSRPGSRLPYSASPATGWPNAARWTRIWWVRPVSRSQRMSVWVRLRSTTW